MRVQPIIPGGRWTIFTWATSLMATRIMVMPVTAPMSGVDFQSGFPMGIHPGTIRITVIILPGIVPIIAMVITMGGGLMTIMPVTVISGMQAMTVIIPLTAEIAAKWMKMETGIPVIVALEIVPEVTEHRR